MTVVKDLKFGYNNMRGNVVRNVGTPKRATDAMTFAVPNLTTAKRDLLDVSDGMIILNITTNKIQARVNGSWVDLH